jgi:sterol desaturase/sphingolipid hydroxylase (fatty acid hydroxylase superfamily)
MAQGHQLDLQRYAVHRCQHAVLFLWRLHAMHHSDPDVDVTTAVRHHPIASLIAGGVYWVAVVALDIPAVVAPFHASAVFPAAAVTHGNMRVPERIEQWLQPAVITLDLHLVRHSVAHDEANANFGAVLSLWDRLFGTYRRLPRAELDRLVFSVRELAPADAVKPSAMIMTPWLLRGAAVKRVTGSPT